MSKWNIRESVLTRKLNANIARVTLNQFVELMVRHMIILVI